MLRRNPKKTASRFRASVPVRQLVFCGLLVTFSATSIGFLVVGNAGFRYVTSEMHGAQRGTENSTACGTGNQGEDKTKSDERGCPYHSEPNVRGSHVHSSNSSKASVSFNTCKFSPTLLIYSCSKCHHPYEGALFANVMSATIASSL